jgi:germination protein M
MSACGRKGADKSGIRVYYLNKADHALQEQNYTPEADDRERIIEELIAKLCIQPKEMTLRAPVTDFRLLSSETRGRIVTLNFSPEYYDLSAVEEVLTRTAIVNTMCSFSEIDGVYFLVDGKKFHDADGEEPGIMEPDQFIYNSYMEMRNYERVRLHLYFANESGDRLVDAYRTVVYNSNMPLERIVLEQVIEGPNGNFAYPTISRETKVINVTTRDRICYVNLSSDFQNGHPDVLAQTALYSIVNSLCELPSIEAVQISVDGQPDTVFMESISLAGNFRMNEDIVEGQPEEKTEE